MTVIFRAKCPECERSNVDDSWKQVEIVLQYWPDHALQYWRLVWADRRRTGTYANILDFLYIMRERPNIGWTTYSYNTTILIGFYKNTRHYVDLVDNIQLTTALEEFFCKSGRLKLRVEWVQNKKKVMRMLQLWNKNLYLRICLSDFYYNKLMFSVDPRSLPHARKL